MIVIFKLIYSVLVSSILKFLKGKGKKKSNKLIIYSLLKESD